MSGVAPAPVTVAVLTMGVPASSSACVTVWLAVYCQVSPTSNRLSWSVSPALKPPIRTGASLVVNGSSTTTLAIAALPWLVTASV